MIQNYPLRLRGRELTPEALDRLAETIKLAADGMRQGKLKPGQDCGFVVLDDDPLHLEAKLTFDKAASDG